MYFEGKTHSTIAHLWRTSASQECTTLCTARQEDLAVDFHFRDLEFLFVVTISSWACLPLSSSKHDSDIS
jgi:hypothetical protein